MLQGIDVMGLAGKMTVGITGVRGLLGTHTRARFHVDPAVNVVAADRSTFSTSEALDAFVSQCDAVIHLAGVNRGLDQDVLTTNRHLTLALISALERTRVQPHVLFASSTHVNRDSAYGAAKRECASLLRDWARRSDARFTNVILPNVFGEGGRAFHNSVVATFARQLARRERADVDVDGSLELLHASTVAEIFRNAIKVRGDAELRPRGVELGVCALWQMMSKFYEEYTNDIVPNVREPLHRNLFNVIRTELFKIRPIIDLSKRSDERGWLVETVKSRNPGQTFVSVTHPGFTRGDHFHFKKLERFIVLRGQAKIRVRHIFDDDLLEFDVDGRQPQYVDMPTLYTHNITNVGADELITQFWTDEIFDPSEPDTFAERVVT